MLYSIILVVSSAMAFSLVSSLERENLPTRFSILHHVFIKFMGLCVCVKRFVGLCLIDSVYYIYKV